VGSFCMSWQSAAYVTVKRHPVTSVSLSTTSMPAVGDHCARAPVNEHAFELVKVPSLCLVSLCHAPSYLLPLAQVNVPCPCLLQRSRSCSSWPR